MEPYANCWCGSGAKFKFCHFRREQAQPINIFEVDARMRAEFQRGYCCHPEASATYCSGGITKAHTVQRRGGLAAISEEGHVLTVKPSMKQMLDNDGDPAPRKVGTSTASVFPGFCNRHDAAFKPVEGDDVTLNAETAFLLSFRAIAYEHFEKQVQLRGLAIQREMDKGHPFWKQVMIQEYLHAFEWGVRRGVADGERWKAAFDARLMSGSRDAFHFLAVRLDGLLPIVAAGGFHVEVDLAGNLLQRLTRGEDDLDHLALNITAFRGKTVAIFGWIGSDKGPAATFVSSFQALNDARKADALIRIAFEQTDNIFLRPSWWAGLPPAQQRLFQNQVQSGTPGSERKRDCLVDRGTSHSSLAVLEAFT
jgi:hypothetical protein